MYFIVQLNDHQFDTGSGIVVIDDPVSSLDSNSMYQAFAFMKNAVKSAKQVFVLTHNFDFLKLILNWLSNIPQKDRGGREIGRYMIHCVEGASGRNATIKKIDPLLTDHPSEYHYLFKTLYKYQSDGSIENAYHIPNIARKVLEIFLDYYTPAKGKLFTKMDCCKFDENKKSAIYKFTNDLSHPTGKGFDPALVAETQNNVKYLLEMIKELAPEHWKGMEESFS